MPRKIKLLRMLRGLNQRQLAREIGHSDYAALSHVENDPTDPRVTRGLKTKLEQYFGVSFSELTQEIDISRALN